MKSYKSVDEYNIHACNIVIAKVCDDMHINKDNYNINIHFLDTENVINEITVIITMTLTNKDNKYTVEKLTLICDDYNDNNYFTFKVISDDTNDVALYLYDTDFSDTEIYFERCEILKSSI